MAPKKSNTLSEADIARITAQQLQTAMPAIVTQVVANMNANVNNILPVNDNANVNLWSSVALKDRADWLSGSKRQNLSLIFAIAPITVL